MRGEQSRGSNPIKSPSLREVSETNDEAISFKIPSFRGRILDFSGILGEAAPKGLELALIKFASSGAYPTKASKNLEFLRINLEFLRMILEFLEIASLRSQ